MRPHVRPAIDMDTTRLSRTISYALRHAPWEYELELDEAGWVPIEQLIDGLRTERPFAAVTEEDIARMIDASPKARFEIVDGRIRAFYGHSVPGRIVKRRADPPQHLYHGTVRRFLGVIGRDGLQPMSRQYVHLSRDREMAQVVARRRGDDTVILAIRAAEAATAGVAFYEESNGVWSADFVAPEWLMVPDADRIPEPSDSPRSA